PPAARGFLVKAAESEIIDLGTEFALEVASGNARVEVLDGEIELRGGEHDGNHLITGQRTWLKGSDEPAAFETLTTLDDVQQRRRDANVRRFNEWKEASRSQRQDPRLIAYYPIAEMTKEARTVRNAASSGEPFDGKVIGPVERKRGRFGVDSEGLDFERTGSRVRTRIEGEFEAFTFTCWARIDSLHHVYNALFMGDGYENGEPHWQIRDDGRLMFSVMVDDAQSVRVTDRFSKTFVQDAGLHRVYFSDPIWDISKSGQWLHLAAVYDPRGRQVRQFVNGAMVSEEQIIDKFFTPKLRIGPSEIGNWGQPFRDSPWFAVRNLNGTIDELAIYKEALDAEEIETMYQRGKPLGY
ncbi:MAG: LamG-like jellyroll fold domain-containing protein, partial [Planctomycetota bacterium]